MSDSLICMYDDCPEGHPIVDVDDGEARVTCPTCRKNMGLPSVEQADLVPEKKMEEPEAQYEVGNKVRVHIGEDWIGEGEITGINPPNGILPDYSYDVRTEKGEGVYFANELERSNPNIHYQTTTTLSKTREVILTVGLAYAEKLVMYVHSTDPETDLELCEVLLTKQRAIAMRIALDRAIVALEMVATQE